MGRGGSSLEALAFMLSWSVCECERFSEYSEPIALLLSECISITSIFLYGVVQPGASMAPLAGASETV